MTKELNIKEMANIFDTLDLVDITTSTQKSKGMSVFFDKVASDSKPRVEYRFTRNGLTYRDVKGNASAYPINKRNFDGTYLREPRKNRQMNKALHYVETYRIGLE